MKNCLSGILLIALLTACGDENGGNLSPSPTSFTSFEDVTAELCADKNGWHASNPSRSFSVGTQTYPASFVDWNEDGYLDYFFSNHHRGDYVNEWDFGLNVPSDNSSIARCFSGIEASTFVSTDAKLSNHDSHGATFADIDGDGIKDLMVSVGGNWGKGLGPYFDNLLFWGKRNTNGTTLEGGREAAVAAGIEGRNERGRFMYVTDANRDGLLDVLPMTSTRADNILAPGVMRINSGDREFQKDPNMQEFASAVMLTDADGDGHAQEYVVLRGTCFRDPSMDETYGPLSREFIEFCEARPENSIAIYKFLDSKITLISPAYQRRQANSVFEPWNRLSARGVLSGDFDNDQKADLIIMYIDKLVFYFSTERAMGDLPLYNLDLGHKGSLEMDAECKRTRAIRAVDLDNNGAQELLVACENPGEFYVFELTSPKTWTVNPRWHLGDLANNSLPYPTPAYLESACVELVNDPEHPNLPKHCKSYSKNGKASKKTTKGSAFSLIDLNNDGFLDAISSHKAGYQRFLINSPPETRNQFIRFELRPTRSHKYGIGTTLLFDASGLPTQFREISTHGNGNDATGIIDDRIVFGLGKSGVPLKLIVRWPSTKEQVIDLSQVSATHISNFSNPIVVTER